MGEILHLIAHTELSIEEIHDILFKGVEFEKAPAGRNYFVLTGFNCAVNLLTRNRDISETYEILDAPEDLQISLYVTGSDQSYIDAMRFVLSWFRQTTGDCAFLFSVSPILLMRVDGNTIRNISEDARLPDEAIDLIDIPYKEADLGFARWEDYLYLRSTDGTSQVAASFCQHLNDNYEIEITEASGKTYATVEMDALSIEISPKKFDPHLSQRYQPWMDNRFGFVPNLSMYVLHKKIYWVKDGERDSPLRDILLQGAVGLIRTSDYSLVLKLDSPSRFVLVYHDGELTLLEDPFWTEGRLRLLLDIPYIYRSA